MSGFLAGGRGKIEHAGGGDHSWRRASVTKPRGTSRVEHLGQNELQKVRRSGGGPLNKGVIRRGRSPDGDRGPQKEEKRAGLMGVCLTSQQCSQRHKPSVSDKFKGLSLGDTES